MDAMRTMAGLLVLSIQLIAINGECQDAIVSQISPPEVATAAEVSIGINPQDKNNLVAGAIMNGFKSPVDSEKPWPQTTTNFSFHSADGGKTWSTSPSINPDNRTQGDDVILFSADGIAVHAYICFVGLWGDKPTRTSNGIFTSRSLDGGKNWETPVAVIDHINSRTPMEDKPWLVFDRNPKSPHFGSLYCSWTRFDVYGSQDPQDTTSILFGRSKNGGLSFEPVIRISDAPGTCVDDDNAVEGAVPCVGVDGAIYVVWAGPRGLEIDQSNDGGETFGADRVILETPGGWASDVAGVSRHNGMPVTSVDHSNGPNRGNLYVNWIDERNGDKDVFLIRSTDNGKTFSEPRRVNDDEVKNGRDQFFTWMAVDPVDGSINIVFYDRRSTKDTRTRLTLARSIDGGQTFKNIDIAAFGEFECNPNVFFGDYIGIDAYDGRVAITAMKFTANKKLALASAVFDFELGKLDAK